jgi:hypothetical protein
MAPRKAKPKSKPKKTATKRGRNRLEIPADVLEAATYISVASEHAGPATLVGIEVPHSERIELDEADGHFYLTDILTREQHQLSSGEWTLVFDDETGEGALCTVCDGEPTHLFVRDLMKCMLHRDMTSKELYIAMDYNHLPFPLQTLQCKYVEGIVKVKVGTLRTVAALRVCVMSRPRTAKQEVFWDLLDLYKLLQLTCYQGVPSSWAFRGICRWSAWCAPCIGVEQFIQSTSAVHAEVSFAQRCLPFPACSTAALLALLARWAYWPRDKGGLSSVQSQTAAREFLHGLLRGAAYSNTMFVSDVVVA